MLVLRAVRSTLVTKASNQTIAEASAASGCVRHRIERHRAGQVVERDIEPAARADQVLDLRIGLGAREVRIELDQHDLRHRQAGGAADLAGEQLRDQRLRSLAGAAELEHVHAVVVRLDDRGHGATLAQRRDVARDGDGAQRAHCCSWKLNLRR